LEGQLTNLICGTWGYVWPSNLLTGRPLGNP
jgi:hypothetical protein